MIPLARRQLGRTDRHVRQARLRAAADAPRHKLVFLAEETLRLCSLPGEEEGRVYYFRRLRVRDLPENGDGHAWLEAFQRTMREQAAQAIHGSNPHAAEGEAVYFHSGQEACETLLKLIARRAAPSGWYWWHISGVEHTVSVPLQLAGVIERLCATPAGWVAVAAAVVSVAREADVVAMLRLLPDEAVARWLRELGEQTGHTAPIRFSKVAREMLARALVEFAPDAPVLLWLASLAAIDAYPALAETRSAPRVAWASLRLVVAGTDLATHALPHQRTRDAGQPCANPSAPAAEARAEAEVVVATPRSKTHADEVTSDASIEGQMSGFPSIREELIFGERTSGAGLYFLLNVLARLRAGHENPGLLFVARLFLRIAEHAGLEKGDPILRWADVVESGSEGAETDPRLLRLWELKIRRWCWRNGRLKVQEIVRRSGYVTLTRTDLDVTMPIESADIRIRRIGLDLDPGWVPWFGRVVRFHYRYRGEICG